jgi:hypothetical protein
LKGAGPTKGVAVSSLPNTGDGAGLVAGANASGIALVVLAAMAAAAVAGYGYRRPRA